MQKIIHWENWPLPFFQFPMGIVWAWFCLRSRSVWFFSSSNPTLEFGGFEGEGKKEMYAQLPPNLVPNTVFLHPSLPFDLVIDRVRAANFTFPVAVKPDKGMKGLLFRKIDHEAQLAQYHRLCLVEYMVQEWVDLPMELSVFYFRHPSKKHGEISGMTWKELIEVHGDGDSTLLQLMENAPRALARLEDLKNKHKARLNHVLAKGQIYQLTIAANRQQGAKLHNLRHEIDTTLTKVFDDISLHNNGQFYWGRYDLKCASVSALRQGKDFKILEFNGAGAAPNHIYHAGLSFGHAWIEVHRNWRMLFEISRYNHQNGVKYWSFWQGLRYFYQARQHFRMLEKLETQI